MISGNIVITDGRVSFSSMVGIGSKSQLLLGNSPSYSGKSLVVVTFVSYLAFRFEIHNPRLSCLSDTLFSIYIIMGSTSQ